MSCPFFSCEQVREKRKREIRGGGHEEQEEGMEEEKVFTDDEPVEVPDEVAEVPDKVDQVPDEVAEVPDKVAENEVEKSRSEKAAVMRGNEGMKRKASTDSVGSVHTPVAVVMKRMRMKGPGQSAMSSSPVMSTPSPIVPKELFPAMSSSAKKQTTMSRFFKSPASASATETENMSADAELPPKKHKQRVKDTVRAMLMAGLISRDGSVIKATEPEVERLAQDIGKEMSIAARGKAGRPVKMVGDKRGVAGGQKSNVRLKGQRQLRQDLPIAMKHKICETIFSNRLEYASEEMLLSAMAKKFSMKLVRLRMIWRKRSHWKMLVEKHQQSTAEDMRAGRGAATGVHGQNAVKHVKMRAAGGGQKLEFPQMYEKVKAWVETERSHGHTVLKRHIAWKYEECLQKEHVVLNEKVEAGNATVHEKLALEKAKKQLKALENPKNQNKRAEHLMRWMGARQLVPNLKTTITEVEQEVRACLTWQYHDSQMHRMAAKKDEDMSQLFARPEEAKANMSKAVLGFSDQIPLWVKMGSEKEIFAAHEVRKSGRTQKAHRHQIAQDLREQAEAKGTSAQTLEDEKKEPMSSVADERNQQLVEHEEDEFQVSDPKSQAASGKTHETVQREISDKYRITFEAHQLVTHWFDESHDPAKAKSKSKAKSEGRIAKEKEKAKNKKRTGERAIQKGQQKELMRKETVKAFKKMKSDEKVESQAALPPADELPLPAPVEPPPEYEKPAGKWRVISEQAVTLYGRQGDILSASEDQYQILFDPDVRYTTEKLSWVRQEYCMRVDELPHPHTWQFPQMSISRAVKQWILHETGTINEDIDQKNIAWDSVEVLSKECPPGGLEAQTVQYGWLLMRYFCSGKRMNELENITMLDPMLCHALGAVKKEEEHGLELDKLIQLFKREMSHKKTFFLPLMSGGHWALLVVDKIHEDIRYYDSLCGDPDRSKIGTEDEITNLPEKCLAMAERLLGAMMSLSVVPDGFCDRPALRRANVRTRQPWGTNQCGHFILAYMEAELLNELGYGPAASGWPAASAHHWHERLRKLTNQLHEEIPKYKRDLKAADEKLLRSGERAHAEMVKEAKVAQMRLDKQETLTELQKIAYEFVHENRYIKISELPPEFEKDRMRIIHHEVGVCSRCRNQSGCLNCTEWKCIRAYMRKEHKRTGRPIEPQYQ
eukprot:Skav209767  [mRNA]  locus=scaffold9:337523:341960:- [translate_table: standard]